VTFSRKFAFTLKRRRGTTSIHWTAFCHTCYPRSYLFRVSFLTHLSFSFVHSFVRSFIHSFTQSLSSSLCVIGPPGLQSWHQCILVFSRVWWMSDSLYFIFLTSLFPQNLSTFTLLLRKRTIRPGLRTVLSGWSFSCCCGHRTFSFITQRTCIYHSIFLRPNKSKSLVCFYGFSRHNLKRMGTAFAVESQDVNKFLRRSKIQ